MTKFLSDANKERLAEMLRETKCPEWIIERMTEFSEDMADGWMYAHAKVCIDADEGRCQPEYFHLSAACMMVMAEEAQKRGWGKDHFPLSLQAMKEHLALKQQEDDDKKTRH